jgi:hypothetical protein
MTENDLVAQQRREFKADIGPTLMEPTRSDLADEQKITFRQAATLASVTVPTVRSWRRAGLEHVTINRRNYTSVLAIKRWRQKQADKKPMLSHAQEQARLEGRLGQLRKQAQARFGA